MTEKEMNNKRYKSKVINLENINLTKHRKYELVKELFGKYFLYETIKEINGVKYLSYPKLGLFINTYLRDMAVEVEWVDVRRTWEYNLEYEIEGGKYKNLACDCVTKLNSIVIWNDSIYVYGSWDIKPTYKQLRPAYENTLWFGRSITDKRDIKLKRLLS